MEINQTLVERTLAEIDKQMPTEKVTPNPQVIVELNYSELQEVFNRYDTRGAERIQLENYSVMRFCRPGRTESELPPCVEVVDYGHFLKTLPENDRKLFAKSVAERRDIPYVGR